MYASWWWRLFAVPPAKSPPLPRQGGDFDGCRGICRSVRFCCVCGTSSGGGICDKPPLCAFARLLPVCCLGPVPSSTLACACFATSSLSYISVITHPVVAGNGSDSLHGEPVAHITRVTILQGRQVWDSPCWRGTRVQVGFEGAGAGMRYVGAGACVTSQGGKRWW